MAGYSFYYYLMHCKYMFYVLCYLGYDHDKKFKINYKLSCKVGCSLAFRGGLGPEKSAADGKMQQPGCSKQAACFLLGSRMPAPGPGDLCRRAVSSVTLLRKTGPNLLRRDQPAGRCQLSRLGLALFPEWWLVSG